MKVFRRNTKSKGQEVSLRDYFAAKVVSGMCADPTVRQLSSNAVAVSKTAYAVADAMLKVREE